MTELCSSIFVPRTVYLDFSSAAQMEGGNPKPYKFLWFWARIDRKSNWPNRSACFGGAKLENDYPGGPPPAQKPEFDSKSESIWATLRMKQNNYCQKREIPSRFTFATTMRNYARTKILQQINKKTKSVLDCLKIPQTKNPKPKTKCWKIKHLSEPGFDRVWKWWRACFGDPVGPQGLTQQLQKT